jgi:hypothetical protein
VRLVLEGFAPRVSCLGRNVHFWGRLLHIFEVERRLRVARLAWLLLERRGLVDWLCCLNHFFDFSFVRFIFWVLR